MWSNWFRGRNGRELKQALRWGMVLGGLLTGSRAVAEGIFSRLNPDDAPQAIRPLLLALQDRESEQVRIETERLLEEPVQDDCLTAVADSIRADVLRDMIRRANSRLEFNHDPKEWVEILQRQLTEVKERLDGPSGS